MTSTKIRSWEEISREARKRRKRNQKCVFTNGCFDLLHRGHVCYLREARSLGDFLVVGLNGDRSVRKLKGPSRPVQPETDRAEILASLECVDYVTLFHEDTPLHLIRCILPDILVKGGDWPVHRIVGRDVVEQAGGRALSIPYLEGVSTSEIIRRIREGK